MSQRTPKGDAAWVRILPENNRKTCKHSGKPGSGLSPALRILIWTVCGEYLSIVLRFSWSASHPEALAGRALPLVVTQFLFTTCSTHIRIGFGHVILVLAHQGSSFVEQRTQGQSYRLIQSVQEIWSWEFECNCSHSAKVTRKTECKLQVISVYFSQEKEVPIWE